MTEWAVVTFKSTHMALRAEAAVRNACLDARLVPAPRQLTHDCGVALRIRAEDTVRVEEILRISTVDYEQIATLD